MFEGRALGIAALLGVVAIMVAVVLWVASPLSSDSSRVDAIPSASSPGDAATGLATVRRTSDVPVAAVTPEPVTSGLPLAAAPTPLPTTRRWDPGSDPVLAGRLDQALVGVDGHIGVAVKDLGSGRWALLDGDLELQSASLYKLPILYTVFATSLNMAEDLPITDEALSYDAGTMELGPGETLTVAEALERMVTLSDNTSAIMLASRVGAGRINASIAAVGMETTHYSLERMTTSAQDMLRLIELMAEGKAVSPAASADMVHLMLRQRVNDRLPRLLPDDVQVAHKTGNLPGTVNDVGILYGPSSTIAIATLTSDTTDETAAATGIARLALAAYSYFEEQPEVTDRPLIPPAPSRPIPPVWRVPHPVPPTPTPTVISSAVVAVEPTATAAAPAVQATRVPASPTLPAAVPPTALPTPKPTPPPPPATATPAPAPPTATPVPAAPARTPTKPAVATSVPPNKR